MESSRWTRIQELFHEAAELTPADRPAFLQFACASDASADPAMAEEVLAMLTEDDTADSLLDRGLSEIAVDMVAADLPPSQEFGPYRLQRILGEGGMGVVWLAERADAGNLVAIKFLPHAGLSPARRERFLQETRTLARLTHPYIARLYDAGTLADSTPWFVMEYVDGIPLNRFLDERPAALEDRLRLFRKVCEAVQHAHGQTVVHRDLKPSNILVLADGTPKLLDFGIARELQEGQGEQTRPGVRFMSPHYSAPEWVREGIVGLTTDVYSLGVILYEILTGKLPPDPDAQSATAARKPSLAAQGSKGAMSLSRGSWRDLDAMCLKAMHPDRAQRYATVEALIRDIDHFLAAEPLEARPDSAGYKLAKFVRRNRAAAVASAAVVVLVIALVAGFTWRLAKARNAALAAASRAERIQHFMTSLFEGNDPEAGPSADVRVSEVLDRGVLEAKSLSAEPEVQADLYQTLSVMYQKLGKFDKAETLLQSAMQQRQSRPGTSYATVAENEIALALLRSDQGKYREAENLARQALASSQRKDAASKPLLTDALAALGHVLVVGGKYAEGEAILNQALSLESKSGQPTSQYAETLTGMADAQMYLGHFNECEAFNRQALAVNRQIYGENHPMVAENLRNLAQVQEARGNYPEAESSARQALHADAVWYGDDNPATAGAMTTLAETLNLQGKYEESGQLLQQALAIQKKTYGDRSARVAYVLNTLGTLNLGRKDYAQAEKDDRQAIDIYRQALGDNDYRVAVVMGNLASVYGEQKNYSQCEAILKQAIPILVKTQSPDSLNIAQARIRLGRTLIHEKKYQESIDFTLPGYNSLVKQANPQMDFVQGALLDLALAYEALHQPELARKYRDELAKTQAPAKAAK